MSSPRDRRSRLADTSGFTLIEALVAFVVLATILSVLFRGVVQMRAGTGAFDDHLHRDLVAQSLLAEALADRSLRSGKRSGLKDGHRWTLVAKAVDLSRQMPPPAPTEQAAPAPGDAAKTPPADAAKDASKDAAPDWVPQRLVIAVEAAGRPLQVATIRLVKAVKP